MTCFKHYLASLASAVRLEKDTEWLFYPGMLPESKAKWWGDFGCRPTAHEGIDICFYRIPGGVMQNLPPGAPVPAWSAGTVLNICHDFLGRSLVVEPAHIDPGTTRFLEIYSHLSVCEDIGIGSRIRAGQIIARIADTHAAGSPLPPHLHLSCIEVPAGIPADALDWSLFPRREQVNVMNPVFMS